VTGRLKDGHCIECRRIYERADPARALRRQKRWRERNPQKVLDMQRRCDLKRNYGISMTRYNALLAEQRGVCAICEKAEVTKRKGTLMRLAVDHDHVTNGIRGLLCNNCNRAVGLMRDDLTIAERIVAYLANWRRGLQLVG
jgi:hypothetical protein